MKVKIRIESRIDNEIVGGITDFHFRLRDLVYFFVAENDDVIAMIAGLERVLVYDEEVIKIFENELSGLK